MNLSATRGGKSETVLGESTGALGRAVRYEIAAPTGILAKLAPTGNWMILM